MASAMHHTSGVMQHVQQHMQQPCLHTASRRMQRMNKPLCYNPPKAVVYPDSVRTYTEYSVYTDEGAVIFKPIPPSFVQAQSKEKGSTYYDLERPGTLLLEFATPRESLHDEGEPQNRKYNWQLAKQQKLNFALSAEELAGIRDLDAPHSTAVSQVLFEHEVKRDPANAGPSLRKVLALAAVGDREGRVSHYTLSLTVTSGNSESSIKVPISRPKFLLLKVFADYLIPRMYGFEYLFELAGQQPTIVYQQPPRQQPGQEGRQGQ